MSTTDGLMHYCQVCGDSHGRCGHSVQKCMQCGEVATHKFAPELLALCAACYEKKMWAEREKAAMPYLLEKERAMRLQNICADCGIPIGDNCVMCERCYHRRHGVLPAALAAEKERAMADGYQKDLAAINAIGNTDILDTSVCVPDVQITNNTLTFANMESHSDTPCAECGSHKSGGVTVHGTMFKYLGAEEWCHLACYIDRCAQRALERLSR